MFPAKRFLNIYFVYNREINSSSHAFFKLMCEQNEKEMMSTLTDGKGKLAYLLYFIIRYYNKYCIIVYFQIGIKYAFDVYQESTGKISFKIVDTSIEYSIKNHNSSIMPYQMF